MNTSSNKHFLAILFVIAGSLFVLPLFAAAATYWVSPTGTATWTNCSSSIPLNGAGACPVQTAFDNAVAGDTVYFREGTYNVPAKNFSTTDHGYYEPANAGTPSNPITFAAYPGETPLFNGTAGGSGDVSDFATIMGTANSNVTFDGFVLQSDDGTKMARFIVWGPDASVHISNVTVKNFTINGGATPIATQDNRETLRIDNADNVLVQKCKLYNARSTSGYQGISGIKSYNTHNITIENCEVSNTESGIYLKSSTDSWTIRNNWVHDNQLGIYMTPYVTSQARNATNHQVYNNVIANSTYSGIHVYGETGSNSDNLAVYNNTIYGIVPSSICVFISESHGSHFYNNILQGCALNQLWYGYNPADYSIAESDYNNFGSYSFQVVARVYSPSAVYNSLAAWKTSGEMAGGANPDINSIASNPLFTNGSGTFTQLRDFALMSNSPSKGTGKSGTDMGANITLVGVQSSSTPPPPAPDSDTTAPSAPVSLAASVVSQSEINLSWTASTDNVGVTGYRVERCTGAGCTAFVQVGTPTTTSFSNIGLLAGTTYQYRVKALDGAGNVSEYSSIVSATTESTVTPADTPAPASPPDTTPPAVPGNVRVM